jgi:hypothetical protein
MKVSAETEPVPLEEVMVETGKNEALAAAFPFLSFPFLSFPLAARLCICLFSRAYLSDGLPKIYSILLEHILSLDLSSFMHSWYYSPDHGY